MDGYTYAGQIGITRFFYLVLEYAVLYMVVPLGVTALVFGLWHMISKIMHRGR
jgi:hypothetical protein